MLRQRIAVVVDVDRFSEPVLVFFFFFVVLPPVVFSHTSCMSHKLYVIPSHKECVVLVDLKHETTQQ